MALVAEVMLVVMAAIPRSSAAAGVQSSFVDCAFEPTNRSDPESMAAIEKCRCTKTREIRCDGLDGVLPYFRSSTGSEFQRLCMTRQNIQELRRRAFADIRVTCLVVNFNPLADGISSNAFGGLERVLEELQLGGCQIRSLPEGLLSGMDELKRLHLWANRIVSIPMGFFKGARNLRELLLWGNEIRRLNDSTLAGLWSLRRLDLDRNRISSLQNTVFRHLLQLEVLHLRENSIKYLHDETFVYMTNLKVLSLDANDIGIVLPKAFQGLDELVSLTLSDNRINYLPENLFANLRNLTRLVLRNNAIQYIWMTTFSGLRSLQYLDLSSNVVANLPDGSFRHTPRLRHLFLDGNSLQVFRRCSFSKRSKLKTLSLAGNNITCDCQTSLAVTSAFPRVVWGTCLYVTTPHPLPLPPRHANDTMASMPTGSAAAAAGEMSVRNYFQHLSTCSSNQTAQECHPE